MSNQWTSSSRLSSFSRGCNVTRRRRARSSRTCSLALVKETLRKRVNLLREEEAAIQELLQIDFLVRVRVVRRSAVARYIIVSRRKLNIAYLRSSDSEFEDLPGRLHFEP